MAEGRQRFLCHVLGAAGFLHHNQSWCSGNCTDENNGESGLPDDQSGKYDAQVCCGMYYKYIEAYIGGVHFHNHVICHTNASTVDCDANTEMYYYS